jgi:hypothetical protein
MMVDVNELQVVVAHRDSATLRVGDMFLKIGADYARTDAEVEAIAMAPVPTPEILWRRPPVLALGALRGRAPAWPKSLVALRVGNITFDCHDDVIKAGCQHRQTLVRLESARR